MKKVYVSFDDIQRQTQDIIRQMHNDCWQPDCIVGITRGGLTPAMLISQYLSVPMVSLDVSLRDNKSDDIGPESNLWLSEWAFGYVPEEEQATISARWDPHYRKNILVVDDINDSGDTINWIVNDWQSSCLPNEKYVWEAVWGKTTRFAVLYDNLASDAILTPTYTSQEINKAEDPSWIVFPWEEWWRRWNPNEEVVK